MKLSTFITKALAAAAVLLSVFSCKKTDEALPTLKFDVAATEIGPEGGSVELRVDWSYCKWKISLEEGCLDFCELTVVYGGVETSEGSSSVTVTVNPNNSKSVREIVLKVEDVDGRVSDRISLSQSGVKPVAVSVDATRTFQTWDGFGAMNSWGDSDYWTKSECDLLFGTLGIDIMRLRIPTTESHWQNLLESAGYASSTYGAKLLASPWSGPAEWKDTGSLNGKDGETRSHLLEEHYEDYALYLEKYAGYMKDNGAALYAISIQNEPDWPASYEGCYWTPEQIASFASAYAYLITSAAVVSGEPMGSNTKYWDAILDDPEASANVDILAGHLYGDGAMKSYSRAAQKGKSLWMTEHLLNESWNVGGSHWDETMQMADEVSDCITNGWNAYIWWYARRYYSFIGDGEQSTSRGSILPRGHAFGQFSRYIDPGDVRIEASSNSESLRVCAFRDASGKRKIVIVNDSANDIDASTAGGTLVDASFTSASENSAKLSVTSDGASLNFTLKAKSISSLEIK